MEKKYKKKAVSAKKYADIIWIHGYRYAKYLYIPLQDDLHIVEWLEWEPTS